MKLYVLQKKNSVHSGALQQFIKTHPEEYCLIFVDENQCIDNTNRYVK